MNLLRSLVLSILMVWLGAMPSHSVAVGINDPEEGGFGGTGHGPGGRPEGIERPEMPERVEPIERPDFDDFDIFVPDTNAEDFGPADVPMNGAEDMPTGQ